ncbi:MAG: type II toxin-antitoxin system RelE/ParE family toxin [Alphaproteobacteria bacterium]|nr:type II toxin-antitoxin system RelE/ParE family toxin [Alphaproteobacteria bacterium]MCW5751391.1 type II toxin-antitoxin system RelE/ParE family toxin [Alphaproteobacteria bacterium]
MSWVVTFLSQAVADELTSQPADIRARFQRIRSLFETYGLEQVRAPHVKHLEGRLWEMRMIGRDGIARAIYVTASGQRVVIVHVFAKKTQKTPRSAMALARRRAGEVE